MGKRVKRNLIIFCICFIGVNLITISNKISEEKSINKNTKIINDSVTKHKEKNIDVNFEIPETNIESNNIEYEIYQYLKKVNVEHIWIVFAQARLESNIYSSNIFKFNNNLFGMKKSYQRPTVREDPEDTKHIKGYSYYKSWDYSIIDYVIWQTSYARNLSEEKYLDKLQSVYAEDKDYKQIISKLSKQLKSKYGTKN